jgi:hypothetical protein
MGMNAQFSGPSYLAVDVSGNIFVSDSDNQVIRQVTPAGLLLFFVLTSCWGCFLLHLIVFELTTGHYSFRVWVWVFVFLCFLGAVTTIAGIPGDGGYHDDSADSAEFSWPQGLTFDRQQNLLICDSNNYRMRKLDMTVGKVFHSRMFSLFVVIIFCKFVDAI